MDLLPPGLEDHIRDAVRHYWRTRQGQATKQAEAGVHYVVLITDP